MTWEQWTWDQCLILIVGPLAILFTQSRKEELAKWACVLGLVGQAAWFWSLYETQRWGGFIASFFYTYAWLVGVRNYWIRK